MTEKTAPAVRRDQAGWVFVHLEGAPYERGLQHGKLLAREIKDVIRTAEFLATWDTGESFETFKKAALEQFSGHLDDEFSAELHGIAEGADVPYSALLAWNGYMDLLTSWWPSHVSKHRPELGVKPWQGRRGHHCSAFIATGKATRDGRIVMRGGSEDAVERGRQATAFLGRLDEARDRRG